MAVQDRFTCSLLHSLTCQYWHIQSTMPKTFRRQHRRRVSIYLSLTVERLTYQQDTAYQRRNNLRTGY